MCDREGLRHPYASIMQCRRNLGDQLPKQHR